MALLHLLIYSLLIWSDYRLQEKKNDWYQKKTIKLPMS